MSDVDWTQDKTDKAVALWIAGGDVVSIASELGATPAEVMARIAQAAANQPAAAPATETLAAKPAAKAAAKPKVAVTKSSTEKASAPKPAARPKAAAKPTSEMPAPAKPELAVDKPAPVDPEAGLRIVPVPAGLALAANDIGPGAAPAAPLMPAAYDPTAHHVPVRTSKRLLAASDGGEGVPFMKATAMECHFPLWADNEPVSIEVKRVCGCRVQTGKSWCAHHLQAVFEPPRKPQPRVA